MVLPMPVHDQVYLVEFTVRRNGSLIATYGSPEVEDILKDHRLRDLATLPTEPGNYRAELKFWFEDDINRVPYQAKYGFHVLKLQRLLPR